MLKKKSIHTKVVAKYKEISVVPIPKMNLIMIKINYDEVLHLAH